MTAEELAEFHKGIAFADYIKACKVADYNDRRRNDVGHSIMFRKAQRLAAEFPDFPDAMREIRPHLAALVIEAA